MKIKRSIKRLYALILTLAVLLCFAASASGPDIPGEDPDGAVAVDTTVLNVSARCAVLLEAETGSIVYEKNADEIRPMASTTKIMTALVALEAGEMSKEVIVSEEAVGIEGSSVYLYEGERLSLEQLLYALMLESANDAATAIAVDVAGSVEAFADMMNTKARELGLENTSFTNPHGLDNENHKTTAYDLAKLTAYALKNDTFREIVSTYRMEIPLKNGEGTRLLINHNKLLKLYKGAIGVKTGFTKKSGRCLVSAAKRDGVTLICVTLDAPDDWNDHMNLFDYGFSCYEQRTLAEAGAYTIQVPVVGGVTDKVTATNPEPLSAVMMKDAGDVKAVVEMDRFLYAPVEAGCEIGRVVFYRAGTAVASTPIVAQENVQCPEESGGFLQWLMNLFGMG